MKRKNKIYYCKAIFLFLFLGHSAYSQINLPFIKYLSDNNFHREHLSYLQIQSKINTTPDSVAYLEAKYYLQYSNDSLFFSNFIKSKDLFIKDTCAFTKANIHFLTSAPGIQKQWFSYYDTTQINYSSRSVFNTWISSISGSGADETKIPRKLMGDYLKYKKYDHRNPYLAGVLSAAVPGLGKLYAGRKHSFIVTLITHVGYGAQAYEAIRKLGMKNPFTIFSISFFGAFYAANIYGSYHDTKEIKYQSRKQFLINAADYYNINSSCGLY